MSVYGTVVIGGEGEPLRVPYAAVDRISASAADAYGWHGQIHRFADTESDGCMHCGGTTFDITSANGITTKRCRNCGHSMQG